VHNGFHMKIIAIAVALALSGFAVAYAATAVIRTSNGYEYTAQDAQRAVAAYYRMATDHNFNLATEIVQAGELPSWDRVAHYIGRKQLRNGTVFYDVWLNEAYHGALTNLSDVDPAIASQIISAMLMAAIDGKLAGPKWKSFYDDATRKDSVLSPAIVDRYYNRHALVAKLAADRSAFTALRSSGVVGLSGNNLTSPISYGHGLIGFARAGIGIARITELLDDQRALAEPESQQFIDDCFSHVGSMLTDDSAKAFLAQQRSLLVVDSSPNKKQPGVRPGDSELGEVVFGRANRCVSRRFLRRASKLQRACNAPGPIRHHLLFGHWASFDAR